MSKNYQTRIALVAFLSFITTITFAQNVDLENLGDFIGRGKPFKISGAIAANSVFFNSSENTGREPFTYFVQGNLNISWMALSIPISYSYSNQGDQLDYQTPFKFNRLSLHPKYRWIQGHIGDVTMTFSPYTLSGHQFTGGGVDLSPKGGFKISAMSGRLLKATENDADARTIPAFSRLGSGIKLGYERDKYKIGVIGFYAKDNINSITTVPEEKGVTPKENLVVSLEGSYKLLENLEIKAEYASTAITQDLRADDTDVNGQGLAGILFSNRASTEYYKALKAGFDYRIGKSTVGLGYERIDPGYETLGAYFFNNDFENITLNSSTTLFNDKINLAFNVGYQRDDLKSQKEQGTNRTVGAVNASYNASEKLMITGSYSNFSTFTNTKVNQFDVINDDNLLNNISDELDYKQLSQNANLNVNYVLSKKEKLQQNININYALADVSNEQGGIVRIGEASTFHNVNAAYTIGFPKHRLNITSALNGTVNLIGREDATTWGPTLAINKKFLDNKLNTGFATSYNSSTNKSGTSSVTNFRANASYAYRERHNFNLNAIQLFKALPKGNNQNLTITFGYNYSFDLSAIKYKRPEKRDENALHPEDKVFSFSYKNHTFSGSHTDITKEVVALKDLSPFSDLHEINSISTNLSRLENELKTTVEKSDKTFKDAAINYLKYLYEQIGFLDTYHELVFNSLKQLSRDAAKLDDVIREDFDKLQAAINTKRSQGQNVNETELNNLANKERIYLQHNSMQKEINELSMKEVLEDKGILMEFKKRYLSKVFAMIKNKKTDKDIEVYLQVQIADFFHKNLLIEP